MARRARTAATPAPEREAADQARLRSQAARLAFVMAGGVGVPVDADAWWSRWHDRGRALWGERRSMDEAEWHNATADHHVSALRRIGPQALAIYRRELARRQHTAAKTTTTRGGSR